MKTAEKNPNVSRTVTYQDIYDNAELIIMKCREIGMPQADCEDVVQELATKQWLSATKQCQKPKIIIFDPSKGSLRTLLGRIARNYAIDKFRRRRHEIQNTLSFDVVVGALGVA